MIGPYWTPSQQRFHWFPALPWDDCCLRAQEGGPPPKPRTRPTLPSLGHLGHLGHLDSQTRPESKRCKKKVPPSVNLTEPYWIYFYSLLESLGQFGTTVSTLLHILTNDQVTQGIRRVLEQMSHLLCAWYALELPHGHKFAFKIKYVMIVLLCWIWHPRSNIFQALCNTSPDGDFLDLFTLLGWTTCCDCSNEVESLGWMGGSVWLLWPFCAQASTHNPPGIWNWYPPDTSLRWGTWWGGVVNAPIGTSKWSGYCDSSSIPLRNSAAGGVLPLSTIDVVLQLHLQEEDLGGDHIAQWSEDHTQWTQQRMSRRQWSPWPRSSSGLGWRRRKWVMRQKSQAPWQSCLAQQTSRSLSPLESFLRLTMRQWSQSGKCQMLLRPGTQLWLKWVRPNWLGMFAEF